MTQSNTDSQGTEMGYSSMDKPVTSSQLYRACFYSYSVQADGRKTHKQAATDNGSGKDSAEHLQGRNTTYSDVHGF